MTIWWDLPKEVVKGDSTPIELYSEFSRTVQLYNTVLNVLWYDLIIISKHCVSKILTWPNNLCTEFFPILCV